MTETLATGSNTIIFQTINIFSKFYCISEIYIKVWVFLKKDHLHSLNISEVIASQKCGYLNALKLFIKNTLWKSMCYGVQNTAEVCAAALLCLFSINIKEIELCMIFVSGIWNPTPGFNTLTADHMSSSHNWQKFQQQVQNNLQNNQHFLQILLHFRNLHKILSVLKERSPS